MSLSPYAPIIGLFALAAAFSLFSVAAARFAGPRRYNKAKLEAYECGIEPSPQPVGGGLRGADANQLPFERDGSCASSFD